MKKNTWNWEQEQMNSFRCVETIPTQEPVLQYPDFTKPFVLVGVGAILSQGKIGHNKPISFASRTLNKAEQIIP